MGLKEKKRDKLYQQIEDFFNNIKNKNPKEVKKIKIKAMGKNIHLKDKRKKFCKFCLNPYVGTEKVRIKKDHKIIICNNCKKINSIFLIKKKNKENFNIKRD